jgi:cytochrome c
MGRLIVGSLVLVFLSTTSSFAGDPKNGARVFNKCKACHAVVAGKNKVGPSLFGFFGRQPGTAPKYKFSKGMKKFGEGKKWSTELFLSYIEKPRKMVKGTKMAFPGLKKQKDREDLASYLLKVTK